jgi:hypothetical protein
MTDDALEVAEYGDLAARTDLSRREIDTLVGLLDETDARYLVLEEWLVEEKPIEPMDGWVRLFHVKYLLDETDDAWRVRVGEEECWVPKSQSTLVALANDVDTVATPSKTLSDFAGGGSA